MKLRLERKKSPKQLDDLTPGYTPYTTIQKIFNHIPINPKKSIFIDLGCGEGTIPLFVSKRYKIRSAGVDILSTYIKTAQFLAKKLRFKQVKFMEKDILKLRFSKSTIIYIAWTCFTPSTRQQIESRLSQLKTGTTVITTGLPINNSLNYSIVTQFTAAMSFGKGTIYIHQKVS